MSHEAVGNGTSVGPQNIYNYLFLLLLKIANFQNTRKHDAHVVNIQTVTARNTNFQDMSSYARPVYARPSCPAS